MIKVNGGMVECSGTMPELYVETTGLMMSLMNAEPNGRGAAVIMLLNCLKTACEHADDAGMILDASEMKHLLMKIQEENDI